MFPLCQTQFIAPKPGEQQQFDIAGSDGADIVIGGEKIRRISSSVK
jgi:hypothetical protein